MANHRRPQFVSRCNVIALQELVITSTIIKFLLDIYLLDVMIFVLDAYARFTDKNKKSLAHISYVLIVLIKYDKVMKPLLELFFKHVASH